LFQEHGNDVTGIPTLSSEMVEAPFLADIVIGQLHGYTHSQACELIFFVVAKITNKKDKYTKSLTQYHICVNLPSSTITKSTKNFSNWVKSNPRPCRLI
jgi:hypothetical protein